MRLTYSQAATAISGATNLCATSDTLRNYINRASEILWTVGFPGKRRRYRVSVNTDCEGNRCVVWPYQIETIVAAAICKQPIGIRGDWFEFNESGPGVLDGPHCHKLLVDRGEVCSFSDVVGANKKIIVRPDRTEADGAQIRLLGYDANGVWIRSLVEGEWQDGELVDINIASPQTTTNVFSKLTGVQKPVTNGGVRLVEFDTVTEVERLIGYYEHGETTPVYRKSILPPGPMDQCQIIDALVLIRFIPTTNDTDYVLPANIAALEEMVKGLIARDNGDWQAYVVAEASAKKRLADHFVQYEGEGTFRPQVFVGTGAWGAGRNLQ
jgi:hypothetical protein